MNLIASTANPITHNTTVAATAQTNALYVDVSVVCGRSGALELPLVCYRTMCVHICTRATLPENPIPKNAANAALLLIWAVARAMLL